MNQKSYIKYTLVTGLFFISLGGLLLHLRIHPLSKNPAHYIHFTATLTSVLLVPFFFLFRRTVHLGYVINGMIVILGIITMGHFSISHPPETISPWTLLSGTTFPDMLILGCKFAAGKALFDLTFFGCDDTIKRSGNTFRYPNMGWWWIHLILMSLIYFLGALIWR